MLIDLRSDTITRPTPAMRKAMYMAEVGDDVYGEDPTVNHLQEQAAALMGKEAALFVPSGTMGNALAILAHTQRGQSILVGDQSHIYLYEAGGASVLGGLSMRPIMTHVDGTLDTAQIQAAITDESDAHVAATGLLCLENTHNRCGGTVLNAEQLDTLATLAHVRNIAVHIDGARIFNAAVALKVPVHTLAQSVDSVMFCLSKGLCAPVGSLLVGKQAFIQRAHRWRKMFGGGMRQAGILAAAGLIALEEMVERLAEDHAHCQMLAQGLQELPAIALQAEHMQTNILIFSLRHSQQSQQLCTESETLEFVQRLKQQGVLVGTMGPTLVRAVTHHDVAKEQITVALTCIKNVLREMYLM